MNQIKILLADDHFIVRQGLRLILETESGFKIVGRQKMGRKPFNWQKLRFRM